MHIHMHTAVNLPQHHWRANVHSETLKATDEYSAAGATAPRVSVKSMEDKIVAEHYLNAQDAIAAAGHPVLDAGQLNGPLRLLTICILIMQNGFTIIGKSAPASAENFDVEKGRRFAYEDAIKQLWPLEGYALRERLSNA